MKIKTLLNTSLSQRQVAKFVRVSKKCVLGVSNKLTQDLPLSNATGQHRKKATKSTEDRHLLQIMKKDRTKSSQMLAAEWNLSNGKNFCSSTVRRRLLAMDYKCYTAKRKPLRNPRQIKERLEFAKEHQQWLNEWNNIIWSDEAHFEVLNRKNHVLVR